MSDPRRPQDDDRLMELLAEEAEHGLDAAQDRVAEELAARSVFLRVGVLVVDEVDHVVVGVHELLDLGLDPGVVDGRVEADRLVRVGRVDREREAVEHVVEEHLGLREVGAGAGRVGLELVVAAHGVQAAPHDEPADHQRRAGDADSDDDGAAEAGNGAAEVSPSTGSALPAAPSSSPDARSLA